jgi:hypothetical protein
MRAFRGRPQWRQLLQHHTLLLHSLPSQYGAGKSPEISHKTDENNGHAKMPLQVFASAMDSKAMSVQHIPPLNPLKTNIKIDGFALLSPNTELRSQQAA